jgi:DNA-binding transcriptional regulator YhcF (GntR family)
MPAIELDFSRFILRTDLPPHRQVAAFLKALIALGQITSGNELPDPASLGARLGLGAVDVRRAYGELLERGFLVSDGQTWKVSEDRLPGASPEAVDEIRVRMEQLIVEARQSGLSGAALLRLFASLLDG